VPKDERVRVPADHTEAGIDRIMDAKEDEALPTIVFVFVFIPDVATASAESVCALTVDAMPPVALSVWLLILEVALAIELSVCVLILDVALPMSVWVASEPELKPAPVSVRVAELHTSTASVPNEERVRDE
jgi:hypothetical protein